VTNKRQGQVLGMLEGVYSGVRHLGRKRELEKHKRDN